MEDEKSAKYKAVRSLYERARGVVTQCYTLAARQPGFTRSSKTADEIATFIKNVVPADYIPDM